MIVKLSNTRISFPNLFEAKAVNGEGEPRFSAVFVIRPGSENATILSSALEQVAREKWGVKASTTLADLKAKGRVCYQERPKTNASGEVYDGFEGMHHVSAGNTARVPVIDRDTAPLTPQDGRPYGGCYVDVSLDIWAQDNSWGKRINAKLRWVQFRADGDAFSGGAPVAESEFSAIAEDLI